MTTPAKNDPADLLESHVRTLIKAGRNDPRFLQRQLDLHRERLELQLDRESPGAKALAAAVKLLEAEVKRDELAFEGK